MMNKIFGAKNITHLLYGIAVLLPMMSILGRVCYTVANKNSKDSYSKSSVRSAVEIQQSSFVSDTDYQIEYVNNGINTNSTVFGFSSSSIDYASLGFPSLTYNGFQIIGENGLLLSNEEGQFAFKNNVWGVTLKTFEATLTSFTATMTNFKVIKYLYTSQTLDNAFEYSLQTFVDDNNLGQVDLFSWFTDMFLDHTKPKNQLYMNFVNWYLNYTLLVSAGYLLFMVMIWFTQYVRKLMDKSMYQDFGGF